MPQQLLSATQSKEFPTYEPNRKRKTKQNKRQGEPPEITVLDRLSGEGGVRALDWLELHTVCARPRM